MKSSLKVQNVCKYIDGFTLSKIDFDIGKGEIFLVGGKNGSGKTKLLETIACISLPSEGFISYFDKTVFNDKFNKKNFNVLKQRLGVLIQDERLFGSLTVNEIFETYSSFYDVEDHKIYYDDCPHIKDELNKRVETLSDGKKQLTKFLLSIGHNPDLVFLDEPTSYLDGEVRTWIFSKIDDMRSKGTSFIISLNQFWDICNIADRLLILEEGTLTNIIPNFKKYYYGSAVKVDKRINLSPIKPSEVYIKIKKGGNKTKIITKYDINTIKNKLRIKEEDITEFSRPKLEDFYRLRRGDLV